MARTGYFSGTGIRLLAHRGLSHPDVGLSPYENTIHAFQAALDAGATHLETDIRATRDAVAVLFHDPTLERAVGKKARVAELTWSELREIPLPGNGRIPSLEDALERLPAAKFNLDVKSEAAISPTVAIIDEMRAHDRVLVSSFSESRRSRAVSQLSAPVATSASALLALQGRVANLVGLKFMARVKLLQVDALQVPLRQGRLRFDNREFISWVRSLGLEIHFWTVNDPEEMIRLVELGCHGLVTDRMDIVPRELRT